MRKQFHVWIWKDAAGNPFYVGWGKYEVSHPAKRLWASRDQFDSPLTEFLRRFSKEPDRVNEAADVAMSREDARALAEGIRESIRKKGGIILDSRPKDSRVGGGLARKVLAPDLNVYDSVRQAATDVGCNPSTITRWCQEVGTDWDYVD